MSFVHLHVHSEYSLLDGFSKVTDLVRRAKALGMPALALTDHGALFGAVSFFNAATSAGIKPIIGMEAYLAARGMQDRDPKLDKRSSHLLLLAENETGYRNLLRIASAAQLDGFYYFPRIDHNFLAQHAEGLICTSGCMSAEVPRAILRGRVDQAINKLDWYYEVFGPDRFFLELQDHAIPQLPEINSTLLELGQRYRARFVATNDVHYVTPSDAHLQDILLAIQTSTVLSDPHRMRMSDDSYYMRSPEEMTQLFKEVPSAISNTLEIAERCNLDLGFKGYRLPEFEVPDGFTPESYLRHLCVQGLEARYGDRADESEIRKRLDYELDIIHTMGFDTYFLIVWDLCRHASESGIWYNARGSAAGSIVAFALNITLVDPIDHGLIFERFLNPGRISMPDIDLDFRDDRRHEMLEYCAEKYGADKVAQIITFGTLKARAAVRDVGRVLDIPLNEVDRLAKMIPNIPGKPVPIGEALNQVPELQQAYQSADYVHELIDTAQQMEGVVRNAGTHAAGVIITDVPIVDYVPLHRPTGSALDSPIKTVTQFEMEILESLGLLKVDFLGLATLTIMARACGLIQERHGISYDLNNIPVDDPETFDLLGRGETAGVFQVEGAGMRRYLMDMKPENLDNVIAMVALFRPGPMEFIPSYIRRMHSEEVVTYRHSRLETIFEETFGIPVYQEQIMMAAVDLAGYSASEADDLRKAIGKKIKSKLMKHRQKFVKGAVANGLPEETADTIFSDWEEFARYGFNKAHAADYGMIAVQTAFLKAHYPVEYMTALLSVNKNDTDKIAAYVADCRRMNLEVLPPDVNSSEWDFTIQDLPDARSAIRFGLGAIKNVGQAPVDEILKARQDGPFSNLNAFARRVDLRLVGKRPLECLIKVGALDALGPRTALLEALDRLHAMSASHFRAVEAGQMSLFGPRTGVSATLELPNPTREISQREQLTWERELLGLYVSDHPLKSVMDDINQIISHNSSQLGEVAHKGQVRVAGLLDSIRPHQTRKGKPMAFLRLEDMHGSMDLVVFPNVWEQAASQIKVDGVYVVDGKVDNQAGEPKILVDAITSDLKGSFADLPQPAATPDRPPRIQETPERIDAEANRPAQEADARPVHPAPESSAGHVSGTPPPPEAFPADWTGAAGGASEPAEEIRGDLERPNPLEEAGPESLPTPDTAADTSPPDEGHAIPEGSLTAEGEEAESAGRTESPTLGGTALPVEPAVENENLQDRARLLPEDLPTGLAPSADDPDRVSQMVTVVLRASGDPTRDILRLRRIHGTLISFPGNDRFGFFVVEAGRSYRLEFPNFTTGVCEDLLSRLRVMVGPENVQVEPITIQ